MMTTTKCGCGAPAFATRPVPRCESCLRAHLGTLTPTGRGDRCGRCCAARDRGAILARCPHRKATAQ